MKLRCVCVEANCGAFVPQLSGVDLAVQIKVLWPLCQILLFSGQAGTADLLQSARERGHDFHLLSKPVHPKDLLKEIQRQETANV